MQKDHKIKGLDNKKHILIYSAPVLVAKAFAFFLIPISTHYLSPQEFGILELMLTTVAIASTLISFGWDSTLTRYLSDKQNKMESNRWIVSVLTIRLSGHFLLLVFIYFLRMNLVKVIGLPLQYLPLLWLVLATTILADLVQTIQLVFRANQQSIAYAITAVSATLANFLCSLFALVVLKSGITGLVSAQIIAGLLTITFAIFRIRKQLKWSFPKFSYIKEALKFGTPLVPATIALSLTHWSDLLMLVHLLPEELALSEVGIYSVATKFSSILALVFVGFSTWWAPYAYSNYKRPNAQKKFGNILEFYFLILFLTAVPIILLSKEILELLTSSAYQRASFFVSLMTISSIVHMFGAYSAIGIGIYKKNHIKMIGGIGLSVLNIALNFFLITRYGTFGAIFATMFSYLGYGLYLQICSQKLFPIPIRWFSIALMSIFLASIILSLNLALFYRVILLIGGIFLSLICFPEKYRFLWKEVLKSIRYPNSDL